MLEKTQAIVLQTTKYGDGKLIVDLLTERFGRVATAIRMATTQKGRLKKQLFQPLTVLSVELDHRPQKPFQQLKDVQLAMPWTTLNADPQKMTVAMLLSEILWHTTRQGQEDARVFGFVRQSLQWLDITDRPVANFHICFLVQFSRLLGIMPMDYGYEPTAFFDMRSATFSLLPPNHADHLRPADAAFLPLLLRMRYASMHLYRFSREERKRCLHLILLYYRLHIPSFPELKSLEVLEQIYAGGR